MLFKDGSDVMINCSPTKKQLTIALAESFSISIAEVFIVEDPDECPDIDSHIKIMCKSHSITGDFLVYLSINVFDKQLKSLELEKTMKEFSEKLKCKCLIDDGLLDPYSRLLVDGLTVSLKFQ